MQQIVSAETVFRRVPKGQFLKLPFHFACGHHHQTKKLPALNIVAKICGSERGLFRRHKKLSRSAGGEDMQLKSVEHFRPMQPSYGQWACSISPGRLKQTISFFTHWRLKVRAREEVGIRVWTH